MSPIVVIGIAAVAFFALTSKKAPAAHPAQPLPPGPQPLPAPAPTPVQVPSEALPQTPEVPPGPQPLPAPAPTPVQVPSEALPQTPEVPPGPQPLPAPAPTPVQVPSEALPQTPEVEPQNVPTVTVTPPPTAPVPAGPVTAGQTPQQVAQNVLTNIANAASTVLKTGSVGTFPPLPGQQPAPPTQVVIPTTPVAQPVPPPPVPPAAVPAPVPPAAIPPNLTPQQILTQLPQIVQAGQTVLQQQEQTPQQDPNGTIALAKLMIDAESSPNWKSALQPQIKQWQSRMGLTADGKFGFSSAYKMALEVGVLPLVRYYKAATQLAPDLKSYRDTLYTMAANADNHNPALAAGLRSSADYEQGQAYSGNPPPIDPSFRAAQAAALTSALGS